MAETSFAHTHTGSGAYPQTHSANMEDSQGDKHDSEGNFGDKQHRNGNTSHPNQQGKGKQSYASFFKDNGVPDESSMLNFITPPIGNINICIDEVESVEATHGFCLIGHVFGARPSPLAFVNFLKGWGGNVKFFFKENGWIKFQFAGEAERERVLNGGPYMIHGRQLFLKKLPSYFLFSKEDMTYLPSWIQIHGLPAECWTTQALSKIASVIGTPIHTDKLTISKKGSSYARVLVEINATAPRVMEKTVVLPSGKQITIWFKYELDPKLYDKCISLGHTSDSCGVAGNKTTFKRRGTRANQEEHNTDPEHVENNTKQLDSEQLVPPQPDSEQHAPQRAESDNTAKNTTNVHETNDELPAPQQAKSDDSVSNSASVKDISVTKAATFNDKHAALHSASDVAATHCNELDSIMAADFLSCVDVQDKEKWKTKGKKNRRSTKMQHGTPSTNTLGNTPSPGSIEHILSVPPPKKPMSSGKSFLMKTRSGVVFPHKTTSRLS